MLHKFRFVIAGIVIILVNQVVTFAVSASVPSALLPAGTTRYAAAYATDAVGVAGNAGWQDVPGMIKYITIPTGQTADVFVHFCGQFNMAAPLGTSVRATLRGQPGNTPAASFYPGTSLATHCADFYWTNVSAGQPAINMQLVAPISVGSGPRTMLVTVNLH